MKCAIVMDPIAGINPRKDTSLAILLAAKSRGWELYYMEATDLYLQNGVLYARACVLTVFDDMQHWYRFESEAEPMPAAEFSFFLLRKDPPVNQQYLHAVWLLEHSTVPVFNSTRALHTINEKIFIMHFPDCIPPSLVASDHRLLCDFAAEQGEVVFKPLDLMGGENVFRSSASDPNLNVILENLTAHGSRDIMAQRYLPEITAGDKRILLIDGEPVAHALARIPAPGDFRGNLAKGGHGEGRVLSERDRYISNRVRDVLQDLGVIFCGLDVIGDYLTEINVTSPTGVRELDAAYGSTIAAQLLAAIEERL